MKARDFMVAESIRKRLELGWFDTQFIQYGVAYWKDDQAHYIICDDSVDLFEHVHRLDGREKYATPIITFMRDLHVPEGRKEVYENKVRGQNIKELRRRLPDAYFDIVRAIPLTSGDAAVAILDPIQEELVGRSHEVYLNIFEGLVELARERYQLSFETFTSYLEWIEKERALIINKIAKAGRFKTEMYGFVYDAGSAQPKLFATATKPDMIRRREELRDQGVEMSPILSQVYSYNDHAQVRKLRPIFMDMAKAYLDADYMETVKAIYDLPTPLPVDAVRAADEALAQARLGGDVANAWRLQKKRWGVEAL